MNLIYSKICVNWPLSKRQKIGFQDQLSLYAGQKYCRMLQREHSAILLTFIKLPFVIKTFVLSIFEWPSLENSAILLTFIKLPWDHFVKLSRLKTTKKQISMHICTYFLPRIRHKMNVNTCISNEINFSDV